MVLSTRILDPALNFLLSFNPAAAIAILSFIVALIISLIYKYATNQKEMKRLKGETKEMQKKIKALKDDPSKMMSIQKDMMKKNMEYMKHSFKATLITFLPIILLLGWLGAHYAFDPISAGSNFNVEISFENGADGAVNLAAPEGIRIRGDSSRNVSDKVEFDLTAEKKGEHNLQIEYKGRTFIKKVLVTDKNEYLDPLRKVNSGGIKEIRVVQDKLLPLGESFKIFGWRPGWLGLYIVFSLIFSMGLRKLMGLY